MKFFTLNEAPSPYQIDQRDRHINLIKTITGISQSKAQNLSQCLQLRAIHEIPDATMIDLGFSELQISRLKAAYDFGKSQFLGIPRLKLGSIIDEPAIAAKPVQEMIGDSRIERGCVLVLDVKHNLTHREVFSIGTETECIVNPRTLFEIVLRHGGTRFLFAHNHPSGNLEPSPEDITLTRQLLEGSKMMEIPMLDHLIVSRNDHISLRQDTALWEHG